LTSLTPIFFSTYLQTNLSISAPPYRAMTDHNLDERCAWTARVQDTQTQNYYCVPCFITNFAGNPSPGQNPIIVANLETIHCFVKGPYEPYNCFLCHRNCTRVQPINNCSICTTKYFDLITNLGLQGLNTTNAHFQYDVIRNTLTKFQILPP